MLAIIRVVLSKRPESSAASSCCACRKFCTVNKVLFKHIHSVQEQAKNG